MGWLRDALVAGARAVASSVLSTESVSAAHASTPAPETQVDPYRDQSPYRQRTYERAPSTWGGKSEGGPAERPYSVLKPLIRTEWDVGDDDVAWTLAEQGQLQLAVQLCEAIESDGVASGLLTTRSAGLLRLPLTITGDEEFVDELVGDETSTLRDGLFWRMFPMDVLARIIRFGILLGAGVGYFVQGPDDPCPILHVVEHQFLVTRRGSDGHARLYYRTMDGEIEVTPGDGRWFVFAPRGLDRFWLYGAWRPVGKFWIAKTVAVDQRMTWGAKMARGIMWITAPNSSTTAERDDIVSFLANAVAPPILAMLEGWKLDNIDVSGTGTQVWKEGKEDANAEIIYALTGQLATSGGTSLGLGSGEIFQNIAKSFIDENAETLAYSVRFYGLAPIAEERGIPTPWATWVTTPPEDQKLIAEAAKIAGEGLKSLSEGLASIEADESKRPRIDIGSYLSKQGIEVLKEDADQDCGDMIVVSGIRVRVEYPEGSIRKGVGPDGQPWAVLMVGAGYGEIIGTEGEDGDAIDAYVGPIRTAKTAYILEQTTEFGETDEYKVFLGFVSLEHAQGVYRRLCRADLEGDWIELPASFLSGVLSGTVDLDTEKPALLPKQVDAGETSTAQATTPPANDNADKSTQIFAYHIDRDAIPMWRVAERLGYPKDPRMGEMYPSEWMAKLRAETSEKYGVDPASTDSVAEQDAADDANPEE